MTTELRLTDPDGAYASVEPAVSLGDAGRLARQIGLRAGWVVDGEGRRVGRVVEGVVAGMREGEDERLHAS